MTPKVQEFIEGTHIPTPYLAFDLQNVCKQYGLIKDAFQNAEVFYAVKANPAPLIIKKLVEVGSSFDAAGLEEINMCLKAGAKPQKISFGNTIKKETAIVAAKLMGIDLFAFDSIGELEKIARSAPGSRVYCRILIVNEGAQWPLGKKFGCAPQMAIDLMEKAKLMGLHPFGLSFHVGSQQTDSKAWDNAIAIASHVANELKNKGIKVSTLNIGGGFPVEYKNSIPCIKEIARNISNTLSEKWAGDIPYLMLEPGRFLVADAGTLVSEVVLVSQKSECEKKHWVYLDIGRFGGLAETEGESIKYDVVPFGREYKQERMEIALAGPTCDSTDTMYEKSKYTLPIDLCPGDRIMIKTAGAYTTTYASQSFNGFQPLNEFYF